MHVHHWLSYKIMKETLSLNQKKKKRKKGAINGRRTEMATLIPPFFVGRRTSDCFYCCTARHFFTLPLALIWPFLHLCSFFIFISFSNQIKIPPADLYRYNIEKDGKIHPQPTITFEWAYINVISIAQQHQRSLIFFCFNFIFSSG